MGGSTNQLLVTLNTPETVSVSGGFILFVYDDIIAKL